MSIGTSGRVVIEIDPHLKQRIHTTLKSKGLTLKEWFLLQAEQLLKENEKNTDNETNN